MSEKLDVSYSLTEEEKRIFRKFKRSNSAKLTKSEFQTMLRSKLVDGGFLLAVLSLLMQHGIISLLPL